MEEWERYETPPGQVRFIKKNMADISDLVKMFRVCRRKERWWNSRRKQRCREVCWVSGWMEALQLEFRSPTLNNELVYHSAPSNWSSCLHSGTPVQESLHYIKFLSDTQFWSAQSPQISSVTYYGFQKEVETGTWHTNTHQNLDSISFLTGPPYVTSVSATKINPQLLYWACYHISLPLYALFP